jgi:hypothetical protein
VEILQLHALKPSLHILLYRTNLVTPIVFKITPWHGPCRNTVSNSTSIAVCQFVAVAMCLLSGCLQMHLVYLPISLHHIVTALHATIQRKTCIISSFQKHLGSMMIIKIFRIFFLRFLRSLLGLIRLHCKRNPDICNRLKVNNLTENIRCQNTWLDHPERMDRSRLLKIAKIKNTLSFKGTGLQT